MLPNWANGTTTRRHGAGDRRRAGAATRATLVREATSTEQVIVEPPADGDGAYDFQRSAELVGSLGRYVFVRRSTYVEACGAHGITSMWSMIWDAARGSEVVLPDDMPSLDAARAGALRALTEDGDGFSASDATMALSEFVPHFDADGTLRPRSPVHRSHLVRMHARRRRVLYEVGPRRWPAPCLPYWFRVRAFLTSNRGFELRGRSALP